MVLVRHPGYANGKGRQGQQQSLERDTICSCFRILSGKWNLAARFIHMPEFKVVAKDLEQPTGHTAYLVISLRIPPPLGGSILQLTGHIHIPKWVVVSQSLGVVLHCRRRVDDRISTVVLPVRNLVPFAATNLDLHPSLLRLLEVIPFDCVDNHSQSEGSKIAEL